MDALSRLVVPQTERDDPDFIGLVSSVLNSVTAHDNPDDIYLLRIDHWFGHRWRIFPAGMGSMRSRRWFQSLVLPPFHPHRVENQTCFRKVGGERLIYQQDVAPLHVHYKPPKDVHLRHRALNRLTCSGVFLWYSGNTRSSARASLMLYTIQQKFEQAWYASLVKTSNWKIDRAEGIAPRRVMQLASSPAETGQGGPPPLEVG